MSVSCSTYCETCNQQAPEIGDQGMLGQPSLETEKQYNDDWGVWSYDFGWIHEGLSALHLVPREVDAYRQFLEHHKGHKVVLVTDHDDHEPDIDWDNLTTFEDVKGHFVNGVYELRAENGDVYRSSHESFLSFEEVRLAPTAIDLAFERLFDEKACFEYFHHTSAVIDPYEELTKLEGFLREHRDQAFVARIVIE